MKKIVQKDFSEFSMLELFRMEVDTQLAILNEGFLVLEQDSPPPDLLSSLMRAAHSIKGAARMVSVDSVVRVSHAVEECLVALQKNQVKFSKNDIDSLLHGIDLIYQISISSDEKILKWSEENFGELAMIESSLKNVYSFSENVHKGLQADEEQSHYSEQNLEQVLEQVEGENIRSNKDALSHFAAAKPTTSIRISIDRLDKIYSLAGKSLVESNQLSTLMPEFWQIKHKYQRIISQLNHLQESLTKHAEGDFAKEQIKSILGAANELRHQYSGTMSQLDAIDRRSSSISDLLHREIMSSRMRPISEILNGLPRMVRDLGRDLNKDVSIKISGLSTLVDRHVLEKIDTPIKHLIQNAVDHGIEKPAERIKKNKSRLATISLDVSINSGMLFIVVEDDGKGVCFKTLKKKILKKHLATEDELKTLEHIALLDFLFYPAFSTQNKVSKFSGRGVGLDVVKDAVTTLEGSVHASSVFDAGMRFQLILPLTVSVLRVFLVTIRGESYSFPLASVDQSLYVAKEEIKVRSTGSFIYFDGEDLQLIHANSVFDCGLPESMPGHISVLILKGDRKKYAVVFDKFNGEQEISLQKLSADFGKIRTINSAAILNNGALTLIVDTEEYIQAIDVLLAGEAPQKIAKKDWGVHCKVIKVLVVDDSLTVRERQRQLLTQLHYNVSVAEDGEEGLKMLEAEKYDLLITDIDMPKMNGIRLINELRFREEFMGLLILVFSNREKSFVEQSVIIDERTRFFEKDIFTQKSFIEAVQQLEKLADVVDSY